MVLSEQLFLLGLYPETLLGTTRGALLDESSILALLPLTCAAALLLSLVQGDEHMGHSTAALV